jgi:hypothetical protein
MNLSLEVVDREAIEDPAQGVGKKPPLRPVFERGTRGIRERYLARERIGVTLDARSHL